DDVARPRTRATEHAARFGEAERGDRDGDRARRRGGVAADERDGVAVLILGKAGGETRQPRVVDVAWERKRQEIASRRGALGSEIEEIDAERLLGNQVGWVIAQKMHALDDRVRGDDKLTAGGHRKCRSVVGESEGAFFFRGERSEQLRDECEFAKTFAWRISGHDVVPLTLPLSSNV